MLLSGIYHPRDLSKSATRELSPAVHSKASVHRSCLLQIADKQKLTFSKQASSCTDTLLCLEDHLLSGGPDDLVSTFQPDAVIPADSILYLKIVL